MIKVADVLRRHGPAYLRKFGRVMPSVLLHTLQAIMACGTGELGETHYRCVCCGKRHVVPRCCGNRHCPSCHASKNAQWCRQQMDRLLPYPYFLLTFTLPKELRKAARRHPREVYAAMFQAASEAMKELAADPRRLGAKKIGMTMVLHTWGRDMSFHPHLHVVAPGGGLDAEGRWISSKPGFFLPCRPLAALFRGKLRAALSKFLWHEEIPGDVWSRRWIVDSQAVGDGRGALKYLAPYVFRVAISDQRIIRCTDTHVTFWHQPSGSRRRRQMTLAAEEFIRRLLQHVLPQGFQKVRHYGLLAPNSQVKQEDLQWVVAAEQGRLISLACQQVDTVPERWDFSCHDCGGLMVLEAIMSPCRPPSAPAMPHSNMPAAALPP